MYIDKTSGQGCALAFANCQMLSEHRKESRPQPKRDSKLTMKAFFSPLCQSCMFSCFSQNSSDVLAGVCPWAEYVVQLGPPPGKQKVHLAIMFPLDFYLWKVNVLHLCTGWAIGKRTCCLPRLPRELQKFGNTSQWPNSQRVPIFLFPEEWWMVWRSSEPILQLAQGMQKVTLKF